MHVLGIISANYDSRKRLRLRESVEGLPFTMCSKVEFELRDHQHTGSVFELSKYCPEWFLAACEKGDDLSRWRREPMDSRRAVKQHYRSGSENLHAAVGTRNIDQLLFTARYLVWEIWDQIVMSRFLSCSDFASERCCSLRRAFDAVYTFCSDRIAAVRQDLAALSCCCCNTKTMDIFSTIAQFYLESLYVHYHLYSASASSSSSSFSETLHVKALLSCVSSIRQLFCANADADVDSHVDADVVVANEIPLASSSSTNISRCRSLGNMLLATVTFIFDLSSSFRSQDFNVCTGLCTSSSSSLSWSSSCAISIQELLRELTIDGSEESDNDANAVVDLIRVMVHWRSGSAMTAVRLANALAERCHSRCVTGTTRDDEMIMTVMAEACAVLLVWYLLPIARLWTLMLLESTDNKKSGLPISLVREKMISLILYDDNDNNDDDVDHFVASSRL